MDLAPILLGGLLALAGVIVSAVVGLLSAKIQADAAVALDSAKRRDDRQLRREDIQRDTLLDLQKALREWMRAVLVGYRSDIRTVRQTGKLGLLGDELSNAEFDAGVRLMYLTERVIDDDLRADLQALRAKQGTFEASRVTVGREDVSAESLESESFELTHQADAVQKHLGVVLRAYLRGRD